jgi:glyoxylase-like metal-dependent hydrolase (beta-lactamase superfamily II)
MSSNENSLSRRGAIGALAGTAAGLALGGGGSRHAQAAAPLAGPSAPSHYRFRLGEFEVTTIRDGALAFDGPHPIFGENIDVAEVQAFAEANLLPPERMMIGFSPVVVNTGTEVVLFDSGNGAARRPDAGQLAAMLGSAGFQADQIDVVVLTHFHPDHIGGLMEEGAPLFPNARYVTNAVEYDFWSPEDKLSGPTERVATLTQSNVVPLAEKIAFIKEGDAVASGIEAIDAFGHTPGHTVFHVESAGKRLMIAADTANHFVMSLERPDWHVRFDMDKDAAIASRRKVFDLIAAEKIPFTGYHMPFPSVGFVQVSDPGYRYIPASYQLDL